MAANERSRVFDFYALEDRILLSGEGTEAATAAVDADVSAAILTALGEAEGQFQQDPAIAAALVPPAICEDAEPTTEDLADTPTFDPALPLEVVFIDAGVDDAETLLSGLRGDGQQETQWLIVELSAEKDGIEQITETLAGLSGVDAVHIVSHGDGQGIQLGDTRLDVDTAGGYAGQIASWADSLDTDADLLIYGCDLASTADGRALIDSIGALCDCDVAASDDATGHESLGGDWELEYTAGHIDRGIAFGIAAQNQWAHTLDVGTFEEGVDSYASTGDTYVSKGNPSSANGTSTELIVNGGAANHDQTLIRFDDIFGSGPNQIPLGSTINSATLEIYVQQTTNNGTVSLHSILIDWNDTATWNLLGTGVQIDGSEATSAADGNIDSELSGWQTFTGLDSTLQSWSDGTANYGWVMQLDVNGEWRASSSEGSFKPKLTVDYTAPTNNAPVITSDGGGPTAVINVAENTTAVTTVSATDADLDTPTFSITDGADQGLFSIDTNSGVLTFDAAPDFELPADSDNDNVYVVEVTADDGSGGTDVQTINVTVANLADSLSLLISTDSNVGNPGADGLPNGWGEGEVLNFAGPDLTHGTGTDGDFSSMLDFDGFTLDTVDTGALHFVSRDMTVGGVNGTFDLMAGDVLVSFLQDETILAAYASTGSNMAVSDGSLLVFRPDSFNDYSTGTFTVLLEDVVADDLKGVTLIEQDTTIGGTDISAGSFLVIAEASATTSVDLFVASGVGAGSTTGSTTELIDVSDLGIDANRLRGIEVIERATTIGGQALAAGSILATLNVDDNVSGVGSNNLLVDMNDVFVLDLTATGLGTTAGTASMFLDGSLVGLDDNPSQENPYALALYNFGQMVVDTTSDVSDGDTSSIQNLLLDKGADGQISLREAIEAANATPNGDSADVILFEITDPLVGGVHTIDVSASGLPTITDAVIIDGTTDSDFSGSPIIELNGASYAGDGLTLTTGSDGSTIRGLTINRFGDAGIRINNSANNTIAGNWIGVDRDGTADLGNAGDGIAIVAGDNTTIGGATGADRNVISGNNDEGIDIDSGVSGTVIQGNYVGTDHSGTAAIGNGQAGVGNWGGILVGGDNTTIGGVLAGEGNVIAGNNSWGAILEGSNNTFHGNLVGTAADGITALGNTGHGVVLHDVAGGLNNLVGGTAANAGNVIAFNGLDGIEVTGGSGNPILGNLIHSNGGLGIDLVGGTEDANGVTQNDIGDGDTGVNGLTNFAVIYTAVISGGTVTISGEATAGSTIEFFKAADDGAGYGEGSLFVGRGVVGGASAGTVDPAMRQFSFVFSVGTLTTADAVTSTVTDAANNTSEFSANIDINDPPTDITPNVFNVNENIDTSSGYNVGTLSTTDPDASDTFSYSIVPGLDGAVFTIGGGGNDELILTDGVLDFETKSSYSVTVRTTDSAGETYDEVLAININDLNDSPIIATNTGATLLEGSTGNTITTAMLDEGDVDDSGAGLTYTITDVTDNGTLFLSGFGALGLGNTFTQADIDAGNVSYDHDDSETTSDAFNFSLADGGEDGATPATGTFNIEVTPVNDNAPTAIDDVYIVDEDTTLDVNWWNADWTRRQKITFDNSAQGQDLLDFPVLVTLHAGNIDYGTTQDDGSDLRFFAADGSALAYDIEEWNEGGTSFVWVKVPRITAGSSSDTMTMYYGNATANSGSNPEAVWTNDFQAVHHLNDDVEDSSGNPNDGINSGSTNVSGQVADGQQFDGVDDFIGLGSDTSIDDIFAGGGTVSAWINPASWGENGFGRVFDKANATLPGRGVALELSTATQSLLFQQGFSGGIGSWASASNSISLNTWQHVSVSYDSSSPANQPTFYINGQLVGTSVDANPSGTAVGDGAFDLRIGNFSQDTNRTFDGAIDDVRISDSVRSADWIHAQFLSSNNALLSFGGEETAPADDTVLGNDSDIDGDPLTVSLVAGPSNALSFTLNADGSFVYTPTSNYNGGDSFTYTINDGTTDSNVATVYITVTAINDAPTVATNETATVLEGSTGNTITTAMLDEGDVDDDDAELTYTITDVTDNGTLFLSGFGTLGLGNTFTQADIDAGNVTYDHDGSETTNDSVGFSLADGGENGSTPATGTFDFTITPDNDVPTAVNDSYDVDEDSTLSVIWWDSDWTRRQELTLNNLGQTETLVDFPVLVVLDSGNIDYAQTKDDGSDLRFFAADGTPLAYEIEQWNEAGESSVWVRVPQITGSSNSDSIWMYYGNAAAQPTGNAGQVWDSNYAGVWHLNEEQAGTGGSGVYQDSTSLGNDGIDRVAATGQAGQVTNGQQFGANDWIEIDHDTNLDLRDSMTISFWLNPASDSGNFNRVVEKGLWGYGDSYYFGGGNGTNDLTFYLNGQEVIDTADGVLTVGVWQHAAVSYTSNGDGTGTARLYLDGVEIDTGTYTGGAVAGNTSRLAIGHSDGSYDFDGSIDEVQIESVDRSADWIAAQHQATRNQASNEFVQFGGEQPAPALDGVLTNDVDPDNALSVTQVNGSAAAVGNQISLASGALLTMNADGTFSYDTNGQFDYLANGSSTTDTFTYTVDDGDGGSDTATTTVTINGVNDSPTIATNTGSTVSEGSTGNTITTAMLDEGDVDDDDAELTYTITDVTDNGTLFLSGFGTLGLGNTFTQADIDAGNVSYDHNDSETTTDSFSFSLADGGEDGATAATGVFNITVTPVNDAPTVAVNTGTTVDEASSGNVVTTAMLNEGDVDDSGAGLTYTVTSVTGNGTLRNNGTVLGLNDTFTQVDIDAGLITYDHNGSETTTDSFGFSLADGGEDGSTAATGTFNFTVNPVNDDPTNAGGLPPDIAVTEDVASNVDLSLLDLSDADHSGGSLTVTLTTATGGDLTATTGGGVTVAGSGSGTLTLTGTLANLNTFLDTASNITYLHGTPHTFGNDADTIIVEVSDNGNTGSGGGGNISLGVVNVDITAVNDSPTVATNTGSTVSEGSTGNTITTAMLDEGDVDDSGAGLTYTVTSVTVNGTLRNNGTALGLNDTFTQADIDAGLITYDHDGSNTTSDSFDFDLADGGEDGATTASGTFNITVTSVNQSPTVAVNTGTTVDEASGGNVITTAMLNEGDPDDSGAGLTYTVTSVTANGTLRNNGTALGLNDTFTQADIDAGLITYDHNGSETTTDSFGFSLADGGEDGATAATGTFSFTVNPINDDPTNAGGLPPDIAVTEDVASNVDLSLLDLSDADHAGGSLTVTLTTAAGGDLTATTGGGVTVGGSGSGTLTLSGTLANLNTFLDTASNISYLHGTPHTFGNDADTITVEVSDNGNTGSGGGGNISLGVVNVDIIAVNDSPTVATNTGSTVSEGSTGNTITTAMLDEGDVDDSGAGLTYTITSVTANGTMYLSGFGALGLGNTFTQADIDAGNVTYDHNDSETTTDSFGFSLADGGEDGATAATGTFNITVTPVNDNTITAISDTDGATEVTIENASAGTTVGITAFADDADTGDTISYSLDNNDGGRFTIDAVTGVVTLASGIDREVDGATRSITVRATSTDTSSTTRVFVIAVSDVDESDVGPITDSDTAANEVGENAAIGTVVGVTALASDDDATNNTITYTLDDDAGGRFAIDGSTGEITVNGALDYETNTSHTVVVRASSSDGSANTQGFTINVIDQSESGATPIADNDPGLESVAENAGVGTNVGLTAFSDDADTIDTISYSLDDNDGGRFAIDSGTGVVTVAGAIDREIDGASRTITVRATSTDGSFQTRVFTIAVDDVDEFDVLSISDNDPAANAADENAAIGTVVGVTALASDGDATNNTISYSLDDDAGGRFAIDSSSGVVTVNGSLDFETTASHDITVRAASTDGSNATQIFTIVVNDIAETPTATNDAYDMIAGTTLTRNVPGVLVNDADPDGDPLSAILVTPPARGTATLLADGTLIYTPNPGFFGIDTITYQVTDGGLLSNVATIQITTLGAPSGGGGGSPPEAAPDPDDVPAAVAPTEPESPQEPEAGDEPAEDEGEEDSPTTSETTPTAAVPGGHVRRDHGEPAFAGADEKQDRAGLERRLQEAAIEATAQGFYSESARLILVSQEYSSEVEMLERLLQLDIEQAIVWQQWDEGQDDSEKSPISYFVGTAGAAAGFFSVGYVLWALRGGAIMTAVASSLPTWRLIDPAAILTAYRASKSPAKDRVESLLDSD